MVAINLLIGGLGEKNGGEFLVALPIGLLVLIVCQGIFMEFIGRRFRGMSRVLLGFGYFIGEFIVGLTTWFGSCLLFVN